MKPKELLNADYLDIVYDQRNKKYGGYELRRHYDQRVRKAVVFALTGVAAMLSFSFISAHRTHRQEEKPETTVIHFTDIKPPVAPPPVKPVTPPPPAPKPVSTVKVTPPVIVPDPLVKPEDLMAHNNDLTDKHVGPANHDGDSASIAPEPVKTGGHAGPGIAKNDKPDPPARWVEQMPQFIGDMNTYIGNHIHYPETARDAGIEGKVIVEFVVNEDGAVTNAKVIRSIGGGCDQEALRIVNGMPKWKPGKQNGLPIKVYFLLPIVFRLD